jgi:hypothetical protein
LLEYFENNTVQLFNLKEDIGEQNDLAKKEPKMTAQLLAQLKSWRKDVNAQMLRRKLGQ